MPVLDKTRKSKSKQAIPNSRVENLDSRRKRLNWSKAMKISLEQRRRFAQNNECSLPKTNESIYGLGQPISWPNESEHPALVCSTSRCIGSVFSNEFHLLLGYTLCHSCVAEWWRTSRINFAFWLETEKNPLKLLFFILPSLKLLRKIRYFRGAKGDCGA